MKMDSYTRKLVAELIDFMKGMSREDRRLIISQLRRETMQKCS